MAKLFSFPFFEEYELENGLHCLLIPDHEQEGLVVALQLPFGRFTDLPGQEGCADICIGVMQKGTAAKSFEQFSDEFEQRGATLFAEIGEEQTMIGVKMLSRFKEILFPCFWEMVTSPRFDERELARVQQEMITALRAETVDPGTIANRHFFHELAGPDHPAGRHHTVRSIRRIRREQVIAFYDAHVVPGDCTLVIAGDFKPRWFTQQCRETVGRWQSAGRRLPCEAPPAEHPDKAIRFIEKNDLTQVSLVVGQSAPGELDERRNRIALANYVLGAGNFSSRLMTRIRSGAGKTYGIVSHIAAESRFGALSIATSTQNRQLEEVLSAILHEFGLFCSDGITAEELEKAKRFAIGNMAFQLEGITNIVEKILWLRFYRRTIEYIENFDGMIRAITLESVNDAIRSCFNPGKLIIVGVGKKSEVLSQLSRFGTLKRFHYKERLR
ncbi:MAG: insulinase family protein [Chitinispirillaceae bacterium]|nr:insulinase family protein [Chitinispirillaceae bacterium]